MARTGLNFGRYPSHRKIFLGLTLACAAAGASGTAARAAIIDWTGGADGLWATAGNWNSGAGPVPANSNLTDTARFAQAAYAVGPNIAGSDTVNGILDTGTADVTISSTSGTGTLTLGTGGIVMNAGSGNLTINASIQMRPYAANAGQNGANSLSFINNSSNTLTIAGATNSVVNLRGTTPAFLNVRNTGSGSIVGTGFRSNNANPFGGSDVAGDIVAPWATWGTGTATEYLLHNAGNTLGGYAASGGDIITGVNSMTDAGHNYDLDLSAASGLTVTSSSNAFSLRLHASAGLSGPQTITIGDGISGGIILHTEGILNSSGQKLTFVDAANNTGGGVGVSATTVINGSYYELDVVAAAGDVEFAAPIVNDNTVHGMYIAGAGPGKVLINEMDDLSTTPLTYAGPGLNNIDGRAGGQVWIGDTGKLILNPASGNIAVAAPIHDNPGGKSSIEIKAGAGSVDLSHASQPTGNGSSDFTGGITVDPGATLAISDFGGGGELGNGGTLTIGAGATIHTGQGFYDMYMNPIIINGDFTTNNFNETANFGPGSTGGAGSVLLNQNTTITNVTNQGLRLGGVGDGGHSYSLTINSSLVNAHGGNYGDLVLENGPNLFTGDMHLANVAQLHIGVKGRNLEGLNRNQTVIMDAGAGTGGSSFGWGWSVDSSFEIAGLQNGAGFPSIDGVPTLYGVSAHNYIAGNGNYVFSGQLLDWMGITKAGTGTQTFDNANQTAGNGLTEFMNPFYVNGGTLNLDFTNLFLSPTAEILYNGAKTDVPLDGDPTTPGTAPVGFYLGGGRLMLTGAANASNMQTFFRTNLIAGGSTIQLSNNATSNPLVYVTGALTRTNGATLNIVLPTGSQNAANGVRASVQNLLGTTPVVDTNTDGIVGGHVTVTDPVSGAVDWAHSTSATYFNVAWQNAAGGPLTISIPAGAVINDGDQLSFNGSDIAATGLPIGDHLRSGNILYAVNVGGGTFQVALSPGGAPITSAVAANSSSNTAGNHPAMLDLQGNIVSYASYTAFSGGGGTSTHNYLLNGNGAVSAALQPNSLKITTSGAGQSLNLAGNTLTLTSGGLLFTGANDYSIGGAAGSTLSSGSDSQLVSANGVNSDLIVHQYGVGTLTIGAAINDGVGAQTLTKTGPGKLALTGINTFSGAVYLNGGTTSINAKVALGQGNNITFNGATLQYAAGYSGNADLTTKTDNTTVRSININAGGATIDTNGNNVTFANPLGGISSNGGGDFTKAGAGTLTVGAVGDYLGATVIKGGVLEVGHASLIAPSVITLTIDHPGGATLTLAELGVANTSQFFVGQAVSNSRAIPFSTYVSAVDPVGGTITLSQDPGDLNPAFVLDTFGDAGGTGASIHFGGNGLTGSLGLSNYAAANLTIDGGTLRTISGVNDSTDRLFTMTANGATVDSSGTGAINFSNATPIIASDTGSRTLSLIGSSTAANSMSPIIVDPSSGTTSIVKDGGGTWALASPNTYTGGTTINNGTLLVTNISGSATGAGNVQMNGGTLGGSGIIAGTVLDPVVGPWTVFPSATKSPTSATTLTLGGLTTSANATLQFNLVTPGSAHTGAGSVSDAINVTGNNGLTLNGGKLAFTNHSAGLASLGYYKIMQYSGSIQGTGLSSLTLPAITNNITYTLSTTQDPGFVDVHRGLLGDANDDGLVNFADFVVLSNNFTATNKGWSGADFNGDGITNFADFVILSNNFGGSIGANEVSSFGAAQTSGVPEPTCLALLSAGLLGVMGTRRRIRTR